TMEVVQFCRWAVQADLQNNSIAGQRSQGLYAASPKQHSIGQHCSRGGSGASNQNLADIFEQKRLASGHKDFFDAEFGRLASDPLNPCEAQLPPRCLGRRTHAAVVTMQVAVEIRVEPKARPHRPSVLKSC